MQTREDKYSEEYEKPMSRIKKNESSFIICRNYRGINGYLQGDVNFLKQEITVRLLKSKKSFKILF